MHQNIKSVTLRVCNNMQLTQTDIPNKIRKKFVVRNYEYEFKSTNAWLHCN